MQIPIRLRPTLRHIRRVFTGPGTLKSTAVTRDILCPGEKVELSPVVSLPGQLEKVTGAPSESTAAAEVQAMTAKEGVHAPTIAYHIRDAVLFGGSIYAQSMRHFIFDSSEKAVRTRRVWMKEASLSSTYIGLKYFGHWLRDDCTLRLLCEQFGNALCVRIPAHPDIAKYSNLFRQDWSTSIDGALIDHLVIMQDFGQNSSKKRRYEILRSRVWSRFGNNEVRSLVYLKRGASGALRLVHNEEEIVEALTKEGFEIVDVCSDSLERILTIISQAKLVVTMEGSHCAHCLAALPARSGLMLLQPPSRFCATQRAWTSALSIQLGFVVGEAVNESSFSFSVPEIHKTIDLMM